MYDVKIQNESGDILKDYNKSGIYVLEAQINGNQIDLHRVSADGNGGYTAVADDQIMNDLPETTQKIRLRSLRQRIMKRLHSLP